MAALHLASYGWPVLLLDRDRFPREKVCGDGLIADSLGARERAGLAEVVRAMGHTTSTASIFSPSGLGFGVPGEYVTLAQRFPVLASGPQQELERNDRRGDPGDPRSPRGVLAEGCSSFRVVVVIDFRRSRRVRTTAPAFRWKPSFRTSPGHGGQAS